MVLGFQVCIFIGLRFQAQSCFMIQRVRSQVFRFSSFCVVRLKGIVHTLDSQLLGFWLQASGCQVYRCWFQFSNVQLRRLCYLGFQACSVMFIGWRFQAFRSLVLGLKHHASGSQALGVQVFSSGFRCQGLGLGI